MDNGDQLKMTFPPNPVYPHAIDSCYELFLVHNTTEASLAADNSPWSQEVPIVPVTPNEVDTWADNGFANIDGELLYYDSVEKNSDGKVNLLKTCARNIGGSDTKFNKKGVMVRSYVIAEHHNQIVNTILKIQDFTGINFDERIETLDFRIRNLQGLNIIFDDFDCPDVNFTFNVLEDDPETGVLVEFFIDVTGEFNSFILDFGDGTSTTNDFSGEHRYAINATIDPVITLSNSRCELIQTPNARLNPQEPPLVVDDPFFIPIPEVPDFPDFTFVPCDVPEADINLPPLVFPCISIEGLIAGIPGIPGFSNIIDINIPSQIIIIGPEIDIPSVIVIEGPSVIVIDPPIPPTIVIDPPIPPTIIIIPPPSTIMMELDVADFPKLEIDWGPLTDRPEITLNVGQKIPVTKKFGSSAKLVKEFGEEFADLFEADEQVHVEYETVGLPSEIKLISPRFPDLKIDTSDTTIKLDTKEANIPTNIKIHGPDSPIPNMISFDTANIPDELELIYKGGPIEVEAKVVLAGVEEIPKKILVEMVDKIPEKIIVEGIPDTLTVDGFPESLIVTGFPDGIRLLPPEEMPEMELVYRGSPIELKITMDEILTKNEDGTANCVMITPCL